MCDSFENELFYKIKFIFVIKDVEVSIAFKL